MTEGRWRVLAPGLMLMLMLMGAGSAFAVPLDDFLAQGYAVVRITSVAGGFMGCRAHREVQFADGTVLVCRRTTAQAAYDPNVTILSAGTMPPSVVLIGAQQIAGALTRLGKVTLPAPLPLDDPALGTIGEGAGMGAAQGPIAAIAPVQSVAALQSAESAGAAGPDAAKRTGKSH